MTQIDLHTHSFASDGTEPPEKLVKDAAAAGLSVIALTDHDTVAGHGAAANALPAGLTLIRGAEVSCLAGDSSVHMLAYLFDPTEPVLAAELDRIRNDRVRRAQQMVVLLQQLEVPVTWERVAAIAAGGAVGRPHVAAAMVEAGVIDELADAFTADWIGHDGRAHVEKHAVDPADVIAMVRGAGGVTVLAHPRADTRGGSLDDELVVRLAEAGLTGIEVDHPGQSEESRSHLRTLAAELGLLPTGSSDFHGPGRGVSLGENTTDPEVYEALVARATGASPLTGS